MQRRIALTLALALVALTMPVGGALAQANTTATPTASPTATPTPSPTATPTATPSDAGDSGPSVRIVPVHYQPEWLTAQRTDAGINTTGPFASFELGRRAEQVEITEPGARANLLSNGRIVKVEYTTGTAPGQASLYHLRLYFPEGEQTVRLYARDTTVNVTTGSLDNYRGILEQTLDDAEAEGFERSPQGAQNYLDYLQERATLFENFFAEKFAQAAVTIITWFRNPIGWLITLLGAALLATWLYRNHGRVLDIISSDPGKSQRRRERIELDRQEKIASAADEHLSDLPEIGTMGEVYWEDAYNVATVYELAELFRKGIPVDEGEGIVHIGGVDALSASSLESSWLEPVVRDGRLASEEIALSHGAAALHRMMSKYGMAMEYRDTYEAVRQLQQDLDEQAGYGRDHSLGRDGSAAGTGGD